MHLQEKTVKSDVVYEGPIFTITHDIAELENGKNSVRDVLHHHGGVCVVPVTENNEIYLVRQFRYPFAAVTTEVPAGKLEKGEDHAACGRRELLEEVGCECSEFIYLGEMLICTLQRDFRSAASPLTRTNFSTLKRYRSPKL